GQPLGVVTAIVGQSRFLLRLTGQAGHAGTLPMRSRRDALVAAAEVIVAAERTARRIEGLRTTVGRLTVAPGAVNVVPGEAELTLDVRHADDAVRERAVREILSYASQTAGGRGLALS